MLDGIAPEAFDPLFRPAIETKGGLDPFRRLGGRVLTALDGTEHFCQTLTVEAPGFLVPSPAGLPRRRPVRLPAYRSDHLTHRR